MARKLPSHLKLHTEDPSDSSPDEQRESAFELSKLFQAFADATGWLVQTIPEGGCHFGNTSATPQGLNNSPVGGYERSKVESNTAPNSETSQRPLRQRLRLVSGAPIDGMLDAEVDDMPVTGESEAWALLEQIDGLIQRVHTAESTVESQQAQLSTALGVSIRPDEADILANRLNESLHRAVEQSGSDAAAMYLLDEGTSQLSMRACWGMPPISMSRPPRDLRSSLGDLEALLGNAVLLENTSLAADWNCPEEYAAAMCVPIGSPTMPHGTIWLFSNHIRDFSSTDIDAAKAAADKMLVDIERSVLADEVLKTRSMGRQVDSASLIQASRQPSLAQPLHADYEIAGWTFQGQSLGGNFHAWNYNRHQHICAALGSAACDGVPGALVATSVQTVVETCWNSRHRPSQILRRANDILWEAEDGDWRSSLAYLQIHPESGAMQLASCGSIQTFVINEHGHRLISGTPTMLAEQPDTTFGDQQLYLEAGEIILLASDAVVGGLQRGGFSQEALLQIVSQMQEEPISEIVDHLARLLPMQELESSEGTDRTLVMLRRRF